MKDDRRASLAAVYHRVAEALSLLGDMIGGNGYDTDAEDAIVADLGRAIEALRT